MSRNSQSDKAKHSARLLSDPVLVGAFDLVETQIIDALSSLSLCNYQQSSAARDSLVLQLQTIKTVRNKLKQAVEFNKITEKEAFVEASEVIEPDFSLKT